MNNLRNCRVFIEYIHPSKRDMWAPKGWWDIMSVPNGWRHARLIVTTKPVPFISKGVEGEVYDAGKNGKALEPMCETFKPSPLNRYLPIGTLKNGVNDDGIKALLNEFVKENPNYDLLSNNCEALARAVAKKIIDGLYPTQQKKRGVVQPVPFGAEAEAFVEITVENGFDDAVIYDPGACLAKGPGPFDIDEIIKEEKD